MLTAPRTRTVSPNVGSFSLSFWESTAVKKQVKYKRMAIVPERREVGAMPVAKENTAIRGKECDSQLGRPSMKK